MQKQHVLPLIIIAFLTIIALASLSVFPIFADEAIYLFWARKILLGMANPFISLYDGKPPLFMWLSAISFLDFHNLLLAGRTVSVLSFTLSLLIVYFGINKLNRRWALFSLPLIALSPFVFFHIRLAILDSLFSLFLLASVFSWTEIKLKYKGLVTGIMIGLAFWTKTPALFMLPFPWIAAYFERENRIKLFKQALISSVVALAIIALLRFSIWFPFLFNRASDFSYSPIDILHGHISQITSNFLSLLTWLIQYRFWPIILTSLIGIFIGIKKQNRLIINLFIALICFIVPFLVLGKLLTPRYYLLVGFILPILASYAISQLKIKFAMILTAIIVLTFIPFVYTLISSPLEIQLPLTDQRQYLHDWSSGIGINQAADFFIQQAQEGKIKVLSEGYFGTLPDGLFVVLGDRINHLPIEIVGVGDNSSPTYDRELAKVTTDNIYYIGNHDRINLINRPEFELVLSYPKVDDGPALEVYRINKWEQEKN